MRRTLSIVLLLTSIGLVRADPDFNRDIRPILSAQCFKCHGPDKKKSDLRLDEPESVYKGGKSGKPAVTPKQPNSSELLARILSTDPETRMPPESDPLSQKEIATLTSWIEAGAPYAKHWAYEKPVRPKLDARTREPWALNPIDFFVRAEMRRNGLAPAPPASPEKLLRRVHLDLIGLPPDLDTVERFLAAPSPEAYAKIVDQLLASPRYGEHWARHWLDLARYADSNGFQADQLRDSWAFRDWVIQAMNEGMPYDRFSIEQLAGDLMPDATIDQKIATGFHRTPTCNVEAGVHPEENRVNQVVDRVNVTATVWLGTTMECAQCHNHKYDPFSTKDYYRLFAFFNNTPVEVKNPSGKGVGFDFYGPKMDLPLSKDRQTERDKLTAQIEALNVGSKPKNAKKEQRAWKARLAQALEHPPTWSVLEVATFTSTGDESIERLDDGSILVGGNVPGTSTYTVTVKTRLKNITGFKLETLTHPSLPGTGPGRGDVKRPNFILNDFSVTANEKPVGLHSPIADFNQPNWEVPKSIDDDPKTGWAVGGPGFFKDHWARYLTEETIGQGEEVTLSFELVQNFGRGRTIGRFRLSALQGPPEGLDLPDDIRSILAKTERTAQETKKLDTYIAAQQETTPKNKKQIAALQKKLKAIKPASTLVMIEQDEPRQTQVLMRGNYLTPTETVQPGVPASLHAWRPDYPDNRLGLARWLMDTENPLVARVAVNRWWAQIFGRGIVATEEDFGSQSEPPTHQALLDWLAVELMENGWSMKKIHRQIVMSQTYRQDARRLNPSQAEADPLNLFLARGARFRLTAENIRDNALKVSGLLSTEMYGPPVYPPQPDNIWRQVGRNEPKYVIAKDHHRYRRGIYVIYRRAAPYPSFVNFDAPDRSACHPKRSRTNTPTQALTLLNDQAYVEMALGLALRILKEKPKATMPERIRHGFLLTLSRAPTEEEIRIVTGLLADAGNRFDDDPKTAQELIKSVQGLNPIDGLVPRDLYTWFYLANAMLNLDEFITKS